jgi:hypothetical protein
MTKRKDDSDRSTVLSDRIPKRLKVGSLEPIMLDHCKPSYGLKSTLSFDILLHRFEAWKKFLSHKPNSKCLPKDTFLAVIITNPAESELLKNFRHQEGCNSEVAQYLSVVKVVLIPRLDETRSLLSYSIANLHKYPHGTLHMHTDQDHFFKEATAHLEVKVIERGMQYDDQMNGIHVKYNADPDRYNATRMLTLLSHIAPLMDVSCSTARKVPSVSCGWSTANAHEYKNNRINMVGSIAPFLISGGINDLEQCHKRKIASMICSVIQAFSHCGRNPTPFFHSDPKMRSERAKLAHDFVKSLVGDKDSEYFKGNFLAEGVSFIFNNFVSFHMDTMNDPTAGMNETLSLNTICIITEELAVIKSVRKAMDMFKLDVGDPLMFTMMVYSRKCIRDHVKRQWKVASMKLPSDNVTSVKQMSTELNWLVGPLLDAIERIDSEVNSNAIWDNPLLLDRFRSFIQRDKSSPQYRGDYISLVAGFDKMRYWSPVKYLVDALQARGIVQMDGETLMGFVCFTSLETNGTFLLAGIIDDAMCTQDPKNGPFSRESRMFGMYAALIFAGYRRNKDTGTGQVYGSSKEPRHQHHNRGSTAVLPIAGGKGLLSFEDSEKPKIVDRCKLVVMGMLDACAEAMHNMKEVRKNRGKTVMEMVCYDLYMKVQDIAGPGVAHIYSLNFIQVASMFGFLPYEFASWACVKSKTSGAYKAINSLYQQHLSELQKKLLFPLDISMTYQ